MSIHRKTYRFRMRPTKGQEEQLLRVAGARRFVYNWALERRKTYYEQHGVGILSKQLSSELTQLKNQPDTAWLKEVDSQALQQALRDLDQSFNAFFAKRAAYPRFRSKKRDCATFRVPQRVKVENDCVYVPKIGWIRIRQSRVVEGTTKGANFRQTPTGKWFVTITTEFEMPDVPLPPVNPEAVRGADVGLTSLVTLDDGRKTAAPKFLRSSERKLARRQRALSRKKKGSNNYRKARRKIAALHERIRNQRQDHLHKLTTTLLREVEGICIEDLTLSGMARTKLAKSVHDAGLGEFRRQIEYKAAWNRKHVAVIDRWYPSSKTCGECGNVHRDLKLSDRTWACPACGGTHDRDVNAARNIRTEGLRSLVAAGYAETLNACGGNVQPPATGWSIPEKQESHGF